MYPLDGGPGAAVWFALVLVPLLLIIPWVFFLLNLRNLLWRVHPANREMAPEHVWLNFIPLFGLGWLIYTVSKVRDSVRAEYRARGWHPDGDFGFGAGLAAAILWILVVFFWWAPVLGWAVDLAWLVCWVIYWLKMDDLKHRLATGAGYGPGWQQAPAWQEPARWQPPAAHMPQQPPAPQPRPVQQPPASQPPTPSGESPRPRTKQCAVCGTTVNHADRFCRGCGFPLP